MFNYMANLCFPLTLTYESGTSSMQERFEVGTILQTMVLWCTIYLAIDFVSELEGNTRAITVSPPSTIALTTISVLGYASPSAGRIMAPFSCYFWKCYRNSAESSFQIAQSFKHRMYRLADIMAELTRICILENAYRLCIIEFTSAFTNTWFHWHLRSYSQFSFNM